MMRKRLKKKLFNKFIKQLDLITKYQLRFKEIGVYLLFRYSYTFKEGVIFCFYNRQSCLTVNVEFKHIEWFLNKKYNSSLDRYNSIYNSMLKAVGL